MEHSQRTTVFQSPCRLRHFLTECMSSPLPVRAGQHQRRHSPPRSVFSAMGFSAAGCLQGNLALSTALLVRPRPSQTDCAAPTSTSVRLLTLLSLFGKQGAPLSQLRVSSGGSTSVLSRQARCATEQCLLSSHTSSAASPRLCLLAVRQVPGCFISRTRPLIAAGAARVRQPARLDAQVRAKCPSLHGVYASLPPIRTLLNNLAQSCPFAQNGHCHCSAQLDTLAVA